MLRRLFALLLSILAARAFAQSPAPADTSGEPYVFERINEQVRFEEDGTGLRDTTAVVRVQSQAGLQQFGQLIFAYSSATENLEIDYVRVRKPDGRVVITSTKDAQDFAPDVLREAPMYSDYRQRHVSVADLRPGDTLEYHSIVHVTLAYAPHEFWYQHTFPRDTAIGEERLEINVPKARQLTIKSPERKFEIQENADRRTYTWILKSFVPDRKTRSRDIEETGSDPDIQLTTFSDWQQVAHWYAKLQDDRVVVDDSVRKKAAELTRGADSPLEQSRRLYDYVARNVRYVSLSFGVGRLQPHPASEVMLNNYGDCKDKHTLLQALLRARGIQSYPVLINSGRKIDADVPSPGQFDHEITAVKLGKGDELTWLDSTTEVAPYGLILYQLRNKQALIASLDSFAGLRKSPAESPFKDSTAFTINGKFSENGSFDATVSVTAQGDTDVPLRAAFREVPQANWQRLVEIYSLRWGLQGDISDIQVDPLDDTSKPFRLSYHFHRENFFVVPTSGANFRILPPIVLPALSKANPRKGSEPLDVGPATEQTYRAHVEIPANFSLATPSAVRMTRDYGDYSSSYVATGGVLEAERHLVLKVNELLAARRADYGSFRNVASSDTQQVLTCSISSPAAGAVAVMKSDSTAEQLNKAGEAALERRDFATAAELLKRSLEKDPAQKDLWYDLGRAYAAANRHDDAVAAFRKQLEADAYHPHAYGELAVELQQQTKVEDAIAAYRKQLEIDPGDRSSHKNLGLLLAQLNRDKDAQAELETAASLPPDDPEIKMALARVYERTGDLEKSQALMKTVTGSITTSGPDIYSGALRDNIDPNQTQREARQTLDSIGDQFDSGEFNRLGPSAVSSMNLVALAWARLGWAKFLQGETLEAMQFLNAAWALSQSGTIANRLARVFEKEGQREKARHMYALAVAAGGAEIEASRQALAKLAATPDSAAQEMAKASDDLHQARTISLGAVSSSTASANFILVFDSSNKPERVEFADGDASLNSAAPQLRQKDFPVKFPDVSSIKLIRRARLACAQSKCSMELLPSEPANSVDKAASVSAPAVKP